MTCRYCLQKINVAGGETPLLLTPLLPPDQFKMNSDWGISNDKIDYPQLLQKLKTQKPYLPHVLNFWQTILANPQDFPLDNNILRVVDLCSLFIENSKINCHRFYQLFQESLTQREKLLNFELLSLIAPPH